MLHDFVSSRLLDQPDRVDIRCVECIIDGSPAVQQLRLNERVEFDVKTCFTPQDGMPVSSLRQLADCTKQA